MSAFDDIVVCIPTVRERAAELELTLAEWRRFGVTPIVQVQPDDWPFTGVSQRCNATIALQRALAERPDAGHIIFSEDDIVIAPEIECWLPALIRLHAPATLFLWNLEHYPRSIARRCRRMRVTLPERIIRVQRLHMWWGTQAVILPRPLAEAVVDWQTEVNGWDTHFKDYITKHGIPLFALVPDPVQHRSPPKLVRPRKHLVLSETFGRRSDHGGISPPDGMDWTPAGAWDPDPRVDYALNRRPR